MGTRYGRPPSQTALPTILTSLGFTPDLLSAADGGGGGGGGAPPGNPRGPGVAQIAGFGVAGPDPHAAEARGSYQASASLQGKAIEEAVPQAHRRAGAL